MLFDDKTYINSEAEKQPLSKGCCEIERWGNRYIIRDGKYRMLDEIDQKDKIITIYRIKLRKTAYD